MEGMVTAHRGATGEGGPARTGELEPLRVISYWITCFYKWVI
jgi:hypothetical protein